MAPIDILRRLKSYYTKDPPPKAPVIAPRSAVVLSIAFTLIYVVPFYVSKTARPSPTLHRDAPSVIRARIRAVTSACICCSLITLYIVVVQGDTSAHEALHLMGWWPLSPTDICKTLLLVTVLFTGPLFEAGIVEGNWRRWAQPSIWREVLSSWIGWRNYVAGPVTEELLFRSLIVPIHFLAHLSPKSIVFVTPLYFGIAHIHHFYEFRLTHPETPALPALLRSLFQFTYTSLFGFFAAFIFLRTASLPAAILAHSFCNWCGLPRFWGRVGVEAAMPLSPPGGQRGKEDDTRAASPVLGNEGLAWTVAYYVLLVAGAAGFYRLLWPLTASSNALVKF